MVMAKLWKCEAKLLYHEERRWQTIHQDIAATLVRERDALRDENARLRAALTEIHPNQQWAVINAALLRERRHQDARWGTIAEHPHSVGEWLLIVEAELHEAKQAWVKSDGDAAALAELLQVAAVCVACFEQHGVNERSPDWQPATAPPTGAG